MAEISGTITTVGPVAGASFTGAFNLSLSGFGGYNTGTVVVLERSTDSEASYQAVDSFTSDSENLGSNAGTVFLRFNCVAIKAGTTLNYKLSQ